MILAQDKIRRRVCSVENCNEIATKKAMCGKHYQLLKNAIKYLENTIITS